MLAFRDIKLEDQEMVNRYMSRYGGSSCQHSFIALFTLAEKYGSKICEQDGFLYTLREGLSREGQRVYLAPMGGGDLRAAYSELLQDAAAHQCRAVFQTVTKDHVTFLKANFPGRFRYTELRDYAEYIYSSFTLSAMKGKRYVSKRNSISNILRTYGDRLEVRNLQSDSVDEIWEFEQKWFLENAATHDEAALTLEKNSIRKQLDHFDELGIEGIGVYIDGEMVAFYYGVSVNDNCFDGIIEKARRDINHLYKFVCWKVSCYCAASYTYFNWEEDVGVPGLRNMKMQLGPAVLLRKFLVEEPGESSPLPESDEIPMISDIDLYPGEENLPGSFSQLSPEEH